MRVTYTYCVFATVIVSLSAAADV